MKNITCVFLLLLVASTAVAEDKSYLCIADKATGFDFDESTKKWESVNYDVDDQMFLIKPVNEDGSALERLVYDKSGYLVWTFGSGDVSHYCEKGPGAYGWLHCNSMTGGRFAMNSLSKRYVRTAPGGYVSATIDLVRDDSVKPDKDDEVMTTLKEDAGGDSVAIEIGKCSEI